MTDGLQCSAVIQKNLNRLDKRANRNLIKFRKRKCKVLHLWSYNSMHQYMLQDDWLESSSVEKDIVVLMVTKLKMNQQCVLAAQRPMAS